MQLIILSHMYPKSYDSYSGIFVEMQALELKKYYNNLAVIAPVPWAPKILWFKKRWREYGKIDRKQTRKGIIADFPRYLVLPGIHFFPVEGIYMYLGIRKFIKDMVKNSHDKIVVHAHTVLPDGLAAILLKKEFNIKVICTAHGGDINIYPFRTKLSYRLTEYTLKNVDSIVAVSHKLKEKIYAIVPRNDINVVTNGAKLKDYTECHKRDNGKIKFLFVGSILYEKGIRELLGAFSRLKKDYPNIFLTIVGYNYIPEWIFPYIKEKKLDGDIQLPGRVEHDEIDLYYSNADIFVLPSYTEGMPTVLFEAMAHKLPIIISDVGGVGEVIRHDDNGLLIEPQSEDDLCNKMRLLIDNKGIRDKIARNAFKDVKPFTWENNAREMQKIYELLG